MGLSDHDERKCSGSSWLLRSWQRPSTGHWHLGNQGPRGVLEAVAMLMWLHAHGAKPLGALGAFNKRSNLAYLLD